MVDKAHNSNQYETPTPASSKLYKGDFTTQVHQLLELADKAQGIEKYEALHKWATHIHTLHTTVAARLQ